MFGVDLWLVSFKKQKNKLSCGIVIDSVSVDMDIKI